MNRWSTYNRVSSAHANPFMAAKDKGSRYQPARSAPHLRENASRPGQVAAEPKAMLRERRVALIDGGSVATHLKILTSVLLASGHRKHTPSRKSRV